MNPPQVRLRMLAHKRSLSCGLGWVRRLKVLMGADYVFREDRFGEVCIFEVRFLGGLPYLVKNSRPWLRLLPGGEINGGASRIDYGSWLPLTERTERFFTSDGKEEA